MSWKRQLFFLCTAKLVQQTSCSPKCKNFKFDRFNIIFCWPTLFQFCYLLSISKYFFCRHGIHPELFQYMAKSFISVIDQTLSEIDAWNSEVSQAWVQLFQWITFGLGKGKYKSIIGLVPTTKITELCWLLDTRLPIKPGGLIEPQNYRKPECVRVLK